MKQMGLIVLVLAMMTVLSACSTSDTTVKSTETSVESPKERSTILVNNDDLHINDSKNSGNRFSYLEQLSSVKQEAFIRFATEKAVIELYNFTPEDMVLVYLHCLSISDLDLIYEITYDGGQLPNKDDYRKEYSAFEYVNNDDSETAVHYRYYDSIEIDESTASENSVTVLITVGVGIQTHTLALALLREDQIWKLDIYHVMDDYRSKASKGR